MAPHKPDVEALLSKAKTVMASLQKRINTVKQAADAKALVLEKPYAELVSRGDSKLIILAQPTPEHDLYIADDEFIYGKAELAKAKPITLSEFRRRAKEHRIPNEERTKLWPKARRLYAHQVVKFEALEQPVLRNIRKATHTLPKEAVAELPKEAGVLAADAYVLARALEGDLKPFCEQTIRLTEPDPEITALLELVPRLTQAIGTEVKPLASKSEIDPNKGNLFIRVEHLATRLDKLTKLLPDSSLKSFLEEALPKLLSFCKLEDRMTEGASLSKSVIETSDVPLLQPSQGGNEMQGADALQCEEVPKIDSPKGETTPKEAKEGDGTTPKEAAEKPKGRLPSLKLPDPSFIMARLKGKKSAGFFSRQHRTSRIGKQQFLLNELAPTKADATYIWGVIVLEEPKEYDTLSKVPEELREGVDKYSLEEFSTESPLFYIPIKLIAAYDPPLKLAKSPESRRFGPPIDIPQSLAKAQFTLSGLAPAAFIEKAYLPAAPMTGELLERNPPDVRETQDMGTPGLEPTTSGNLCECSSCGLHLPAPKTGPCSALLCPYCSVPMTALFQEDLRVSHPAGDFKCPNCGTVLPFEPRTQGFCPNCGTMMERFFRSDTVRKEEGSAEKGFVPGDGAPSQSPQAHTYKEPWLSFRGLTPDQVKRLSQNELVELYEIALHALNELFVDGKTQVNSLTREDVQNALVFITDELKSRGLMGTVEEPPPPDSALVAKAGPEAALAKAGPTKRYAPIASGSIGTKPEIKLQDVLPHFGKEFLLRSPIAYLVGSLANNGKTKNDIDILIRGPIDEATEHILKFRIGRMLPPELSSRVEYHGGAASDPISDGGPFTAYCPLYDLVVKRRNDYQAVVEMRDSDIPIEYLEMQDPEDRKQFLQKQDVFLHLPEKERPRSSVLHIHFRGKSAHGDLRIDAGEYLIGYTLALQISGRVPKIDSLPEAKSVAKKFDPKGSRWNKSISAPSRIFTELKAPEPLPWLDIDAEEFEPGSTGATRFNFGYMVAVARPRCSWGERTPYFHEYFLEKDANFQGLLTFRLLVSGGDASQEDMEAGRAQPQGQPFWVAMLTKSLLPSVVKHRAVQVGRIPPKGWSFLPPGLKAVVPKRFQYWHADSEKERKEIRDALVEEGFFTEDNIKIVDGQFRRVTTKYYLYEPDKASTEEQALDPFSAFIVKRDSPHMQGFLDYCDKIEADLHSVSEEELDGLHKSYLELAKHPLFKYRHNRTKCMRCSQPPTKEVIWCEGRAHAWFCNKHYKEFEKEQNGEIDKLREIDGEASIHWNQPIKKDDWNYPALPQEPSIVGEPNQDASAAAAAHMQHSLTNPPPVQYSTKEIDPCQLENGTTPQAQAPLAQTEESEAAREQDMETEEESEKAAAGKFPYALLWQRWKGQMVIRAAPSKQVFHLLIDRGEGKVEDFQLLRDPTQVHSVTAIREVYEDAKGLLDFEGDVPPKKKIHGVVLNDTRDTPSVIRKLSAGKISFLQDDRLFKKFSFEGKDSKLKGYFVLRAERDADQIWVFEQSDMPKDVHKLAVDTTSAGRSHKHRHIASVDRDGNGKTNTILDHFHEIKGFEVQHARHPHEPAPGHTHDLIIDVEAAIAEARQGEAAVEKKEVVKDITLADGRVLKDVQVWDPSKISPNDDKTHDRERLRPFALYAPMKVAPRDSNEFRSNETDRLFEKFATPAALEQGIVVEPKYNGFRSSMQRKETGDAILLSEEIWDRKSDLRDLLTNLPSVAEELKSIDGPYILDGEFTAVDEEGTVIPRRNLAQFRGKDAVDDSGVRIYVFDILYHPKEGNVTTLPYLKRRKLLAEFLRDRKLKHLKLTPFRIAKHKTDLLEAINWARRNPASEGAMLKMPESTVSLRETDMWAKLKAIRELYAIVYDRHPVKGSPGVYNFYYALGPISQEEKDVWAETVKVGDKLYIPAGKTFNVKLDAKVGDVIRIEVTEILYDKANEHKQRIRGFTPVVMEKVDQKPTKISELVEMLDPGEIKKSIDSVRATLAERKSVSDWTLQVAKSDEDERYVLGVVLVPNEYDSQGDIYDEAAVRQASEFFMEFARRLGLMHETALSENKIRILENYIAPVDFELEGQFVKKGTWLLAARVLDDRLWQAVKDGALTGWSIEGSSIAHMLD